MKRPVLLLLFIVFLSFILTGFTGCGGGGGGGGGGGSVQTGYFTDGPVEGLSYSTATQSGTTDADGSFQYYVGEQVSFRVGDVLVGQATGASTLTPFDLAGITAPQSALQVRRTINDCNKNSSMVTPFEQAANIAVFLQTLDEDGNLTNGIQIPGQMHALAAGVSIDFDQKWSQFPSDFPFRKLIADGRAAGLWGGNRVIRNPAYALDALYEGLGITPDIYAMNLEERDTNADGTVDELYTDTYDANGNRTMEERDTNADGTVDYRYTNTYDANGNRTISEFDTNADGTVDSRDTDTYDANGNRTMSEFDTNADGTVDSRYTYTYDANGNQTMHEQDYNADGIVDSRNTYTYDANGNQTMHEQDYNADGTVDYRNTNTYDANGNQTIYEVDNNADGTVDSRNTNTYDANGNQTMHEQDHNADGTAEYRETYTNQLVNGWMLYYWDW